MRLLHCNYILKLGNLCSILISFFKDFLYSFVLLSVLGKCSSSESTAGHHCLKLIFHLIKGINKKCIDSEEYGKFRNRLLSLLYQDVANRIGGEEVVL